MDTKQVGEKLVASCRDGRNMEAIEALYSRDIVSLEAMDNEQIQGETRGIEAIKAKNQAWMANHQIHSTTIEGPFVHHDRFAVKFRYDLTSTAGAMKGQRMTMDEVGLYTVAEGKIVKEEFFYSM